MKISARAVAVAIKKSALVQQEIARSTTAYGLSLALPAFIAQCDSARMNQLFNLRELLLLQIDLFNFSLEHGHLQKAYKERSSNFEQDIAEMARRHGLSSEFIGPALTT